jgi:hypothetical protein
MSSEGGPPGPERRAAPRHGSQLRIVCYPAGAGFSERRQVRLQNISRNGLAVIADRRWEPGTTVIAELPVGEEGATIAMRARVIHLTAQLGGCFLVGCSFEAGLTDAQIQLLTM